MFLSIDQKETVGSLLEQTSHLDRAVAKEIRTILRSSDGVATSLHHLSLAEVPVEHSFTLTDERPIYYSPRRLPSRQNDIVRNEIDAKLKADIITSAALTWYFTVAVATMKMKRMGSTKDIEC